MKFFPHLLVSLMLLLGGLAQGQMLPVFEDHFNSGDWMKPKAGGDDYWTLNFSAGDASSVSEESGLGLRIVSYSQDETSSSQVTVAGPVMQELNFFASPITFTIENFQTSTGGANGGPSGVVSYFAVSNIPNRVPGDLDRAIYIQYELNGTLTLYAKTGVDTVKLVALTGVNAKISHLELRLDATEFQLTYQTSVMAQAASYNGAHGLTSEQWGSEGSSLEFGARVNNTQDRMAVLIVGSIAVVPEASTFAMLGGSAALFLLGRMIANRRALHE